MKKALIIIGIIVAVILLIAAILPSKVHVERSIVINAPTEIIFDQVSDLKKNFNWSPWLQKDPEMSVEWGEVTSGLGASYSWSGNNDVGTGTMTIGEIRDNEFIRNDLDFGEMGKGTGTWEFETSGDGSVNVTWGMDSELPWPVGRFFGLFMDGMVGADFETGLSNLKEVSESMPETPKLEVMEVETEEMILLVIRDSVAMEDMRTAMGENMSALGEFVGNNQLEVASGSMCRYVVWNEEEGYTVMECAMHISAEPEVDISETMSIVVLPAGKAAMTVHNGAYEQIGSAHYAIDEWINTNNKEVAGASYERYVNSPMNESDPSNYVTEVYYPIQ